VFAWFKNKAQSKKGEEMGNVEECSLVFFILARLTFNVKGKVMHGFFFCCVNFPWKDSGENGRGNDFREQPKRGKQCSFHKGKRKRWLLEG